MDDQSAVPDRLVGCWRRASITFPDGSIDDSSQVIWLQTHSAMADLRLDGARPDLIHRTSAGECTAAELIVLAASDSSSGHTRVVGPTADLVPVEVTAVWHTGADGVDYQPVSRHPEPGLLSWSADGRVMTERAPSGAYVEEWHRLGGSDGPCGHAVVDGAVRQGWYVVGDHAMYVRDRAVKTGDDRRIDEVIAALDLDDAADRARAEALVDCEFSYARRIDAGMDRAVVDVAVAAGEHTRHVGAVGPDRRRRVTPDLIDQLCRHAASEFGDVRMLPARAYTSRDVLAAERARIFSTAWTCVARSADLPMVGDHVVAEVPAGDAVTGDHESVIVVRGDDGALAAFRNVCAHRCSALLDTAGNSPRITCPYHAWTYRLDGQLIAAPHMQHSVDGQGRPFDTADHHLTRLAVDEWEGFVFVSPLADPPPLAPVLEPLRRVIGRYRLAGYVPVHRQVDVWNTNWKCLVENFMDAYHVFKVHRNSFAKDIDSTADTTVVPGTDAVTHHVVVDPPTSRLGIAHPDNVSLEGTWRHTTTLAAVFPTLVMQVQPDFLWYMDVTPIGLGQARVRWDLSVAPEVFESLADPDAFVDEVVALLNLVNSEDRPIVEGVWRGLRRDDARGGPLSYLERNVFDFDRYVSRRLTDAP